MEFITSTVFTYQNYRLFLEQCFSDANRNGNKFTYKQFSELLGLKSHSFIIAVLNGKRNMKESTIKGIIDVLKMSSTEGKYFYNLVMFNQVKDVTTKEHFYKETLRIKKLSSYYNPTENQYKYFEKWYYSVIKEYIDVYGWNGDYKALQDVIVPKISIPEVKASIRLLQDIGFINSENDVTNNAIIKGDNVPIFIKEKGRAELLQNGIELLNELDADERFCHHSTFAMDKEVYDECAELYSEFVEKIYEKVTSTKNRESDKKDIYNMVFQMFPGTIRDKEAPNP